jgi:hypothetical protein
MLLSNDFFKIVLLVNLTPEFWFACIYHTSLANPQRKKGGGDHVQYIEVRARGSCLPCERDVSAFQIRLSNLAGLTRISPNPCHSYTHRNGPYIVAMTSRIPATNAPRLSTAPSSIKPRQLVCAYTSSFSAQEA